MPTYEFLCQKCSKTFEMVLSMADYERRRKKGIECPKCASSKVIRQISGFQVKTSKKS